MGRYPQACCACDRGSGGISITEENFPVSTRAIVAKANAVKPSITGHLDSVWRVVDAHPAVHGVVRWRLRDLAWWVFEEFRISLDETTVGRELRRLGYRKLTARPQHHAQDESAIEHFKRASPPASRRSAPRCRPAPP